jgi:hypothetical protein
MLPIFLEPLCKMALKHNVYVLLNSISTKYEDDSIEPEMFLKKLMLLEAIY